jgi:hypothetical protein
LQWEKTSKTYLKIHNTSATKERLKRGTSQTSLVDGVNEMPYSDILTSEYTLAILPRSIV